MKAIKTFLLSFILVASTVTVTLAQGKSEVAANEKSPYSAHAKGWLVDVNKAYAESKKTGKPILANFTGSDWCGWCKKLKYEVFDKLEFETWAKDNVVLLELDFPRRFPLPENIKKQNKGLQQAFKVTGYPTIWVFNLGKDSNNQFTIDALGKTGYVKGVSAFTGGVDAMIAKAAANGN